MIQCFWCFETGPKVLSEPAGGMEVCTYCPLLDRAFRAAGAHWGTLWTKQREISNWSPPRNLLLLLWTSRSAAEPTSKPRLLADRSPSGFVVFSTFLLLYFGTYTAEDWITNNLSTDKITIIWRCRCECRISFITRTKWWRYCGWDKPDAGGVIVINNSVGIWADAILGDDNWFYIGDNSFGGAEAPLLKIRIVPASNRELIALG